MIKLGVISGVKDNPFRFSGLAGENNSIFDVVASPSPYLFCLPEVGASFTYADSSVSAKRLVATVSDTGDSATAADPGEVGRLTTYFDSQATPKNLELMAQGDCYIGKHGRAYFSRHAFVHSESYRSKLLLDNNGDAELRAYNWRIASEDGHAQIFSGSSAPGEVFGDSLTLERTGQDGVRNSLALSGAVGALLRVSELGSNAAGEISVAANGDIGLACRAAGEESSDPLAYLRLVNAVGSTASQFSFYAGTLSGVLDGAATLAVGDTLGITSAKAMTLDGLTVTICAGTHELAFKSALDALKTQLDNFISSDFANHMHATAGSGAPSTPMTPVPTPAAIAPTGTTKTKAG